MQFDDRIFRVELNYGNQTVVLDGGLDIHATGTKFVNSMQNDCHLKISNLKKETRDKLGTQLTMFNYGQSRKSMKVFAGRKSTGLFQIFKGDIVSCTASQPPNIDLNIVSKTMNFWKFDLVAQSQNVSSTVSSIASGVGTRMGIPVRFEATDKSVSNYSHTGSTLNEIEKLNLLGAYDIHIDNDELIVRDKGVALKNSTHVLNQQSGMIGVPELTEYGVRVKCLLNPAVRIGGQIQLESVLNPFLNGVYTVYQMGFDIASRDTPFYCIIEMSKYPVIQLLTNTALPQ